MSNSSILTFHDQLQERITALYATKFHIDEMERLTKKNNTDQSLDVLPLFIQLAGKHDIIRAMDFSSILSKRWQEEITQTLRSLDIKQFTNIYQLLHHENKIMLDNFVAKSIVRDIANPIQTFDANSSPKGSLQHCAIKETKEFDTLIASVMAVLNIRPHITMLYMLSICETILPGVK